jgi:hypothetical protein
MLRVPRKGSNCILAFLIAISAWVVAMAQRQGGDAEWPMYGLNNAETHGVVPAGSAMQDPR